MNDPYPFRGWLWLALGIVNLLALALHLLRDLPVLPDIAAMAVCALVFFFHRRLGPEQWERSARENDPRELAVSECAARMTLKLMAVLLLAIAQLSGLPVLLWGYYGALALGVGIYYLSKAFYNSRL